MRADIIYEKKYPRISDQSEQNAPTGAAVQNAAFDEFIEKLNDITYAPIPGRAEGSKIFIRTAIEISEQYELDITIQRHKSYYTVTYSFDCGGGMTDIGRIFGMADQFAFFKDIHGTDITIVMDYYTHAAGLQME